MARKLTMLGMAIAALAALAIPAMASAAPVVTDPEGVILGTPANLKGVSNNAVTTNTPLGTLECGTVEITAKLTENTGSKVKAEGTGGTTAVCETSEEEALTVTNPTLVSLTSTTAGSGSVSMSYTADVGSFECPYSANNGTFTYANDTDIIHVHAILTTPFVPCRPVSGSITFEGTFTITTSNGAIVTFD